MHKILSMEDRDTSAEELVRALTQTGHQVDRHDGLDWFAEADKGGYSLILLVTKSDRANDAIASCSSIRWRFPEVPVLVLSHGSSSLDRAKMLDAGADDCLQSPFEADEGVARARSLLRRVRKATERPFRLGELVLNARTGKLTVGNRPVDLARRECEILAHLLQQCGKTVSRAELSEAVWGTPALSSNLIEVHVRRLRAKLGHAAAYIQTIRGVGYRVPNASQLEASPIPTEMSS